MICSICGGRVEWQGPLSDLTHTKCLSCGEINCQCAAPVDEWIAEMDEVAQTLADAKNKATATHKED